MRSRLSVMSSDTKDLVKKRSSFKCKLTQFTNFLGLFKNEKTLNPLQINEIECRLIKIDSLYGDYDDLQTQIELLSEDQDEAYAARAEFEAQYYAQVSLARTLLAPVLPPGVRSGGSSRTSSTASDYKHSHVMLPKIDPPRFNGDYQHWLGFRDTYLSLIHNDKNIDPISKYHYLRSALSGSAALVIESLDFKAENYAIAWQLLSNRYDNEQLLVNNHVQALFNLELIQRECSSSLRNMIDVTNKNLRSLENLGQPTDHWDTLIIYMMSRKLDPITSRKWEEYRSSLGNFPTLNQFITFLGNRANLLETIQDNKQSKHKQTPTDSNKSKNFLATSSASKNTNDSKPHKSTCPMCAQDHHLFSCSSFRALDIDSRIKKVAESKVCKNCLRPGHFESKCRLSHCKYCKTKHNTLLHKDTQTDSNTHVQDGHISLSTNTISSNSKHAHVLLSTALVKVSGIDGTLYTARLLLDSGSTSNFVTQQLCARLGLVRRSTSSTVSGINDHISNTTESCDLHIESYFGGFKANISCLILPKITNQLPGSYIDTQEIPIPKGLQLADPTYYIPSSIDILVGAEIFWNILGSSSINIGVNQPKLHASKLGWLLSGCVYQQTTSKQSSVCHFVHTSNSNEELQLTRFWELDSVSSTQCLSTEEQACEQIFKDTTRQDEDGRFVVTIPLKDSPDSLGDSYVLAKRRLLSLERRLERDSSLQQKYLQFMQEYLDLGHMTENTQKSNAKVNYYLPHHGVVRDSSTTTKLRAVFDASANTTSGKSFNDIQMIGPTVQDDLLSILLRFRQHRYVVSSDIEKMYRAILVEPCQRPLQQIVFRFDPSKPLKTYTLNTVTYGTASAPYLATKCLVSLADQCPDSNAANSIRHDFYVDDYVSGNDSIASLVEQCKHVINTLESAKFRLRKWQSNCPAILDSILSDSKQDSEKTLNLSNTSSSKTLGLYWDSTSDDLFFSIHLDTDKITKRTILSLISQIFDPMGLVGPVIVEAKLIIQQLWLQKCSWDEAVTDHIRVAFLDFVNSLPCLNSLRIPRWVSLSNHSVIELHIFTDASERAYGSCVYVRTAGPDGTVRVRLLASKNKVAPMKPTTIPRLELCGALLGSRLYQKVLQSLTVAFDHCFFWCDSTIVLGWLSTPVNQLKPFVRNRVSEIQDSTQNQTWSYVPSKQNPADLASRGVKADFISASALWWSGPEFLHHREIQFPKFPNIQRSDLPETSPIHYAHLTVSNNSNHTDNILSHLTHKSSNFTKLVRVLAYVQRFIYNCRNHNSKLYSNLSYIELQSSQNSLLHFAQQEMFPDEYNILKSNQSLPKKNRLLSLTPFIDSNKLIRVGGRLDNSNYSYDIKHPILLCSKHHLTRLIFETQHKTLLHAGPQLLLANIRQTYWPLGGRNLSKRVVHACVRCYRFKTKPCQIIMGNLPSDRTHLEFPFLNTGIDYAGPVLISDRKGRGSKLHKAYICVFICFAVKAVHLELVTDLTKEAFLAAFSRFTSRRGKPSSVYSDNGTSFVGGFNELSRFLQDSSHSLETEIAQLNINFKFIPPYSPHFGGIWEAAVKSVKHLLRRTLSLTHLTYEELSTCLIHIEAILNSRPLTPLSSDPSDLTHLSPSHFLIGRPLTSVPHPQLADTDINRLQRFQRIEKLRQHFWKRYSDEYVCLLQQKTRWTSSTGELKIGDLVLIKDANRPPLLWLLGRVEQLHKGSDGASRVAELRTKKGTLLRAYNNLCPLPTSTSSSF